MQVSQAIPSPQGLSVFGSALIRVAPDVASLTFSASRQQKKPRAAFEETRSAAAAIRAFLDKSNVGDVQASRVTLSQQWDYVGGKPKPGGYVAKASFNVLLDDLDQLEAILSGVVDAGANEITEVSFQSRTLKEHRVRARQQAVAAAREKALVYATAAGKGVGEVLHIEDANPDQLQGSEGHVQRDLPTDGEGPLAAFDPGSITVGAAVLIVFQLTDRTGDE